VNKNLDYYYFGQCAAGSDLLYNSITNSNISSKKLCNHLPCHTSYCYLQ